MSEEDQEILADIAPETGVEIQKLSSTNGHNKSRWKMKKTTSKTFLTKSGFLKRP